MLPTCLQHGHNIELTIIAQNETHHWYIKQVKERNDLSGKYFDFQPGSANSDRIQQRRKAFLIHKTVGHWNKHKRSKVWWVVYFWKDGFPNFHEA